VKLIDSLLEAIVRLEGDALVMHVGEKPYVVTASASMNAYRGPLAWGQVELSSRVLTFDAVQSMLGEILPPEQQHALDEFGAIEHEILAPQGLTDRFTVVAARGGEDIWLEVRRRQVEPPQAESQPEAQADSQPAQDATLTVHASDAAPSASVEQLAQAPAQVPDEIGEESVPDDAIQIVDDEPQGIPTEEEVDAMLAATATTLLTSSIMPEIVDEREPVEDQNVAEEEEEEEEEQTVELVVEQRIDAELEAVVVVAAVVHTSVQTTGEIAAESSTGLQFELSPPGLMPIEEAEPAPELVMSVAGAPLFDEAVMAATSSEPAIVHRVETPVDAVEAAPELAASQPVHEPAPQAASEQPVAGEPIQEPVIEQAADAQPPTDQPMMAPPPIERPLAEIVVPADLAVTFLAPEIVETPPVVHEGPTDLPMASAMANFDAGHAIPADTAHAHASSPPEMSMDVTPDPRVPIGSTESHDHRPAAPAPLAPAASVPHEMAFDADEEEERSAVVVPLARTPIRPGATPAPPPASDAPLLHTLQIAAARGASTLYVVAQSRPLIRVDGEFSVLEGEPVLTAADVDRLVMDLAPPRRRDALQNGPIEWICDVPELGRVRCQTFRDYRGPGVIFRMFPPRAISADQLGLTPEVQALASQSDGLVLVTGARASGKSTLLNAFVDLINRTRSDHVITIESQIGFVHESRRSFISQRETRGDAENAAAAVRAAVREDPDVMVIEDLRSAEIVAASLEAAESGRLVFASLPASSTIAAIERLVELLPADRRPKARTSLAGSLRGVVAQVLLRKVKGGRAVAREILLNTPAVATLILEGKTFQLPVALDSGRRHGMVPLTDSLAAYVRDGSVHVAEAYRKALDRPALLALLKREGIDTSFAETIGSISAVRG
jgi:twitching motility protein PilT